MKLIFDVYKHETNLQKKQILNFSLTYFTYLFVISAVTRYASVELDADNNKAVPRIRQEAEIGTKYMIALSRRRYLCGHSVFTLERMKCAHWMRSGQLTDASSCASTAHYFRSIQILD